MGENKLGNESSPYLLQHAKNPVDWYAWNEEALDRAKKENKPIFLSVGYSSCHWCHVMAHESFEDNEIAKIMNDKEKIQESLRIINDLVELSSSILRECDKDPDKNDLAIKYLLNQKELLEKLKDLILN